METGKIIGSKAIGERIKFRRQDIGMSQERLAEILGVTYQQVQRYENGKNKLNVENIQMIANALSMPVTSFFTSDGYPDATAEPPTPYATPDERTLLKHYRDISAKSDKQIVVNVARLAARK